MKICLIKPPILHKGASFALMPTPPLGLAYIAGVLKQAGHRLQVIDACAEGIDTIQHFNDGIFLFGLNKEYITEMIDDDTEVICFSFMFTNNWLHDRELVKEIRKRFPDATLIAGGEHATAAPELCMKQAPLDFIVMGEGEQIIFSLVEALKLNIAVSGIDGIAFRNETGIAYNKRQKRISNIADIPRPAWELFPLDKYFTNKMTHGVYRGNTLPVMATRGCPYDCTFCSSPQMWGRIYDMRPPENFVDELEYLHKTYNVVNFDLYDLTAIIVKDWIIKMCREIQRRNLKISFQLPSGTRAEAIDYEVAKILFESGCKNITYAPESGSLKVLKEVKKKVNPEKMLESIKYSNRAGMNIHLNMIIGFPDDTHRDIWSTLWFLLKCSWYGAHDIAVAVFTPYPGSELFKRLSREGRMNLYNDNNLKEIIDSYDLWPSKVYSEKISQGFVKFYVFLLLIFFYTSNYIFRPHRLFATVRNMLTQKHESRLEQILYKNFIKNFFSVKAVGITRKLKDRVEPELDKPVAQ